MNATNEQIQVYYDPKQSEALLRGAADLAQRHVINSAETADFADTLLENVKERGAALLAQRTAETAADVAALNAKREPYRAALLLAINIETALKQNLAAWHLSQQALKRDAITVAADAHAVGDNETARKAMALANDTELTKPSSLTIKEFWTYEITDKLLVPRDWCKPDDEKLASRGRTTHINQSPPSIPGVRWFKVSAVTKRKTGAKR
jgi:hypothetical protein